MLLPPVKGKKATNNYRKKKSTPIYNTSALYSAQYLEAQTTFLLRTASLTCKISVILLISLDLNDSILQSRAWEEVAGLLFWNGFGAAVTVTLGHLLVSDSVDAVENWVL